MQRAFKKAEGEEKRQIKETDEAREPSIPFDSWMDITAIERYVGVWKQLLLFVFRTEEDEPDK